MDEISPDPDRQPAELASKPLKWEVPIEEILAMSPEELIQEIINQSEKIRRLYEVAMLAVHSQAKPEDINHILNPEKLS